MNLSVNITQEHYLSYDKFAVKRLYGTKTTNTFALIKNMVLWCVLTIILMTGFQMEAFRFSSFHWPTAFITMLPFVAFIGSYVVYLIKYRRLSIPNENGVALGQRMLAFNEDGMTSSNEFQQTFYRWCAVEDVVENAGHVYIFVDKLMAQIVPKESFNTQQERVELIAFVQGHMTKRD